MLQPVPRLLIGILVLLCSVQESAAQRGGEVTVTITPPPSFSAVLTDISASGAHKLHFQNTTSRDAKVLSMEILFIEQTERSKSCDLFFGNVIGAAVRRYDLKDVVVLSAKSANATTKLLPEEKTGGYSLETPENKREPRVTIIACYKFTYTLDDAELEVYPPAGRWTFDRKTGKLITKNVAGKAELLPR